MLMTLPQRGHYPVWRRRFTISLQSHLLPKLICLPPSLSPQPIRLSFSRTPMPGTRNVCFSVLGVASIYALMNRPGSYSVPRHTQLATGNEHIANTTANDSRTDAYEASNLSRRGRRSSSMACHGEITHGRYAETRTGLLHSWYAYTCRACSDYEEARRFSYNLMYGRYCKIRTEFPGRLTWFSRRARPQTDLWREEDEETCPVKITQQRAQRGISAGCEKRQASA